MAGLQPPAKHQPCQAAEEPALNLELLSKRLSCPFMNRAHDRLA